jgi:hypothetical protein
MSGTCRDCSGTGRRHWPIGIVRVIGWRIEYVMGFPFWVLDFVPDIVEAPCLCQYWPMR